MAVQDFEDLIKQIKRTASTENIAAATIALRLYSAQLSGPTGGSVNGFFEPDVNSGVVPFEKAIADIKARVSTL
jgi:hypothetical protein